MKLLRPSLALGRAYLLESLRSPLSLFWMFAFPQLFLVIFAVVFGGGDPERVTFLLPGLLTITTMTSSFYGFSVRLVFERDRGALRRLRVTPIPAASVILGHMLHAAGILALSLAVQVAIAMAVFGARLASPAATVVALVCGGAAFVPMGLFVGCVAPDVRSAPVLNNLIVFPQMFLSGSAVPFFMLPTWVQKLARLMPATFLNEALYRTGVRGETGGALLAMLGALVACGLVGVTLNAMLFRWEPEQRIPKRRLALALLLLATLFVVTALAAPPLEMTHAPAAKAAASTP